MSRDSKGSVKISTGAVVCNESELRGDITIGARTVIHPKAKIIAESGDIIIGKTLVFKRDIWDIFTLVCYIYELNFKY